MESGVVKFYNKTKGYGFITCGDKEVFVHISALNNQTIDKGDKVTFDLTTGKKGLNADNVLKINLV